MHTLKKFIYVYILPSCNPKLAHIHTHAYSIALRFFIQSSASTASMCIKPAHHSYACTFKLLNVLFISENPLHFTGMPILFFAVFIFIWQPLQCMTRLAFPMGLSVSRGKFVRGIVEKSALSMTTVAMTLHAPLKCLCHVQLVDALGKFLCSSYAIISLLGILGKQICFWRATCVKTCSCCWKFSSNFVLNFLLGTHAMQLTQKVELP